MHALYRIAIYFNIFYFCFNIGILRINMQHTRRVILIEDNTKRNKIYLEGVLFRQNKRSRIECAAHCASTADCVGLSEVDLISSPGVECLAFNSSISSSPQTILSGSKFYYLRQTDSKS